MNCTNTGQGRLSELGIVVLLAASRRARTRRSRLPRRLADPSGSSRHRPCGGRRQGGRRQGRARSGMRLRSAAQGMLGTHLVTKADGARGVPVEHVYVESGSDMRREDLPVPHVERGARADCPDRLCCGRQWISKRWPPKTPEQILTVNIHPGRGAAGVSSAVNWRWVGAEGSRR